MSLYFWNKCIYLKKLCWIKFHVRLSSKALKYCPTVPPATQNPRILKQLGEKADEVYLGHTVLIPTALHRGDPGPQQPVRLNEVRGSLSEKTPPKPLGRSERPPLAVFLVTILSSTSSKVWHHWQQDVMLAARRTPAAPLTATSSVAKTMRRWRGRLPQSKRATCARHSASVNSSKPWITLPRRQFSLHLGANQGFENSAICSRV